MHVQVVNMPWLNRVEAVWARELAEPFEDVFVVEDHAPPARWPMRYGARSTAGRDGVRRRRLAGVRDAARGAALPRTRRLLARGPHRTGAARTHSFVTPVWLVLPDPFSSRLFFDTGIVERLRAQLGERLELFLLDTGEQADAWSERAATCVRRPRPI